MCTQKVAGDYMIADLGAPVGYVGSFANGINASGVAVGDGIIGRHGGGYDPTYGYTGTVWQNGGGVPTWAKATRLRLMIAARWRA